VRREAFAAVGGFDGALSGDNARGIDVCLRLRRAGGRIVNTPWARLIDRRVPERDGLVGAVDAARLRASWGAVLHADPYYSPHLATHPLEYRVRV
jgi:hypothetical protein